MQCSKDNANLAYGGQFLATTIGTIGVAILEYAHFVPSVTTLPEHSINQPVCVSTDSLPS